MAVYCSVVLGVLVLHLVLHCLWGQVWVRHWEQQVPGLHSLGDSLHADLPAWEKWVAAPEPQVGRAWKEWVAARFGSFLFKPCRPVQFIQLLHLTQLGGEGLASERNKNYPATLHMASIT
jgi:hypothetical protein